MNSAIQEVFGDEMLSTVLKRQTCKAELCTLSAVGSALVNLFHPGGLVSCTLNLFQRRQVVIITKALVVVIDAEAKLDHPVDAAGKLSGLIQVEAGGEQGGVEEEPDQVLDRLVGLVCGRLLLQLGHDAVLGVNLHGLLPM